MTRHVRTPQETFLSDQALAHARDLAQTPGTAVVVLDYATDGQCTWCDCPDSIDSLHAIPGYRCDGCEADAYYLATLVTRGGRRIIPLCKGHFGEFKAMVNAMASG